MELPEIPHQLIFEKPIELPTGDRLAQLDFLILYSIQTESHKSEISERPHANFGSKTVGAVFEKAVDEGFEYDSMLIEKRIRDLRATELVEIESPLPGLRLNTAGQQRLEQLTDRFADN